MAKLFGPDFIALQVRDLARSSRFYVEQLGLTPAKHSPTGAVVFDTVLVPFALRKSQVELADTDNPGWGISLWMSCDDADRLHAALTQKEVPIVAPPADGPFGRFFALRDPDGYTVTVHTVVAPPTNESASMNPAAGYITLINTFSVEPDKAEELLAALSKTTDELLRHMPGFVSANLHLSVDRRRIVNYAQWRSQAEYDAMAKRPEVKTHMQKVAALALSFDPVFYELRESKVVQGAS